MILNRAILIFCLAGTLLLGTVPALAGPQYGFQGQAAQTKRQLKDETLASTMMSRSMPYRVLLPSGYDSKENQQKAYSVLYLLHGLTGGFKDWSDKTAIAGSRTGTDLIIVMPEGANGWYTDSAVNRNEAFESYIIKELIPEVEKKFRTRKERNGRAVAGLSMGGYGALKFGVKYPDLFYLAGSFSGALRAPEWDPAQLVRFPAASNSIKAAFGPMDSTTRKENDIYVMVRAMDENAVKKLPYFYLDCGTEDFLLAQSRDFAQLLLEKKIAHEYRQLPGVHDWKFWNAQIEQFLDVSQRFHSGEVGDK